MKVVMEVDCAVVVAAVAEAWVAATTLERTGVAGAWMPVISPMGPETLAAML